MDYIKWRGDLPFDRDPLNSVDAVIFASIAYMDFGGVIPEHGEITFREASEKFFELHSDDELLNNKIIFYNRFAPPLLRQVAQSVRFSNLRLSHFVDHTDIGTMTQFAAYTIRISDNEVFIAFRGTDDSIVGWKEDFYLSLCTVSSEDEAVQYLIDGQGGKTDRIYLGGHSKGGHLSVYSAFCVDPEIQNRIVGIFDLDGPGFNEEQKASEQFRKISSRITRIIPENSIIGRLLEDTAAPIIVSSTEKGVMQHDPMSWQLEGKEFISLPCNSVASDVFDDTLSAWIRDMDLSERKQFTDDLFSVLEASGVTNISQMSRIGLLSVKKMLDRLHMVKKESQGKIRILIKMFIDNWGEILVDLAKNGSEESKLDVALPFRKLIEAKKGNTTEEAKT